jgi:signal transduction histidine kinase
MSQEPARAWIAPEDFQAAIRLFDETTGALAAQVQRLEQVLARKQAELVDANRLLTSKVDELDRLTGWLNLVMGSVASGVVAVDCDGSVTTCNQAAMEALAGVVPNLIEANYLITFPGGPVAGVLADGHPRPRSQRRVQRADGSVRLQRVAASPLRTPAGELVGAVEVFEDVTELMTLQERAERADRLQQLGEMAAGVAHEIRNPLNGIEGFASLLVRDFDDGRSDPVRHRRYAAAVVSGVRDLNRTVSGLLAFTRVPRLDRKPTDPQQLAAACLELVRVETASQAGQTLVEGGEAAAVDLSLDDHWPGGTLALDPALLRQVLINLLQNAVHAVIEAEDLPRPRRVRLGVQPSPGGVTFVLDDSGPGVPAEVRARIFTPFFTTRSQGTGLGLAIAHTIVTQHGGSIQVEDGPLGGARFIVTVAGG